MNFIIRHETDGYVDIDTRTSSFKAKNYTLEDIASMVGALSISPANNSPCIITTGSKLMIKEEGQIVSLESTLEIKTRVFHKSLRFKRLHHNSGYLKLLSLCEQATRMVLFRDQWLKMSPPKLRVGKNASRMT
jgi:hypothetical protein